jgi:cobalamin-dependent methionine synthase I
MLRIGENLNVMVKKIGTAMKEKDPGPIRELAEAEAEKKVDWIDINLGPARKGGPELMEWIVKTVQEVVPDIPLALDTSNVEAIEAGLKVHKGKAMINSIMARPERMEAMIPLAAKYNARVIGLLWGPSGMPRDENERSELTVTLVSAMLEAGRSARSDNKYDKFHDDVSRYIGGIGTGVKIYLRSIKCLQWSSRAPAAHIEPDFYRNYRKVWYVFSDCRCL